MEYIPRLIYVPILHIQKEVGNIANLLRGGADKSPFTEDAAAQEKSINEMWDGIESKIEELNLSYPLVRIYQEALPVCGREAEIVTKLAEKGSRNHQFILKLMKNGARIEGTEDPDLLVKEYDYLMQLFNTLSINGRGEALKKYQEKSKKLILQRDAFIAVRIKTTIKHGEIPLLFMSVNHQLEKLLKHHFVSNYIIYRLPFNKVKNIYNV